MCKLLIMADNTIDIAVGGCEMAVVKELIRTEGNGSISLGD